MSTANALVFEAAEQGSVVLAQLAGVINEDNALHERLTSTSGKGVLIDLAKVERINSCGVRDWIRFAQRLEAAGNALYLLRCSPVVVAQLNMVRNFCGEKGHVVSFQAPYFCPNCDEERTETFDSSRISNDVEPPAKCPTCEGQMEFDDLPDLYFAFARIHGGKQLPPEIQSAAAAFRDGVPASKPGASGARPSPAPPPAPATRPSSPALPARPPAATAPAPAPARPSGLKPAVPAPAAAAAAPRPSGPKPAAPAPVAAPAPAAPAAPAPAAPAAAGVVGPARSSGPRMAMGTAKPLVGGSPFPARASGPRPSLGPPAAPAATPPAATPPVDPTKK